MALAYTTQVANLASSVATAAANVQALVFSPLCNGATINIYSGTQPATANTPLAGNTLLATLAFSSVAFGAPVNGVLTANPIAPGTAVASGVATFARVIESDGVSVVMDVPVGLSSAAINLNTTAIVDASLVSISSFTYAVSA